MTLFYQIRDSYVYIVMRYGYIYFIAKFFFFHHFVPDVDVSDYIMFSFLLLCKVVHNKVVQFRY